MSSLSYWQHANRAGSKNASVIQFVGWASRSILLLFVGFVFGPYAPFASGQDTYLNSIGVPTFTEAVPVENGFVNLANGNLHLEIPLGGSFPQRGGGAVKSVLKYDSKDVWQRWWYAGYSWQPTDSAGGWGIVATRFTGKVSSTKVSTRCDADPTYINQDDYDNFAWTAADGTVHRFSIWISKVYPPRFDCPWSWTTIPNGDAFATDNTGYHMYAALDPNDRPQATVFAPDGTQVYPTLMDANGNFLSGVDTLNRTPVTASSGGDDIWRGTPAATFTYDVLDSRGSTQRYTVIFQTISVNTNFLQPNTTEYSGTLTVVQEIDLPDGTKYQFTYDSGTTPGHFGTMTSMTLPTGGQISYGYANFADVYNNRSLWLSSRSTSGPGITSGTWFYTPQVVPGCAPTFQNCQHKVTLTTPGNDDTVYTFIFSSAVPWLTQMQSYTGSATSGALLSTLTQTWDFSSPCPLHADCFAPYVVKLTETTTLPVAGGANINQNKRLTWDPSHNGNVTKIEEWNFYTGSLPATPDRIISKNFTSASPSYLGKNIVNRPTSSSVSTGSGVQLSQTNYIYDSTALTSVSGITHHDDVIFGTSNTIRGNLTQVQRWAGGASYLNTTNTYDTTGQQISTQDPNGNVTNFSYSDCFRTDNGLNPPAAFTPSAPTNAYLTQTTLPLSGSMNYCYYFNTGKPASSQDQNAATIYWHYLDPWDRPSHMYFPDGGWSLTQYTSATQLDSYSALTDTTPSTSCTGCRHDRIILDSLGRTAQTVLVSDPEGADFTDTAYDSKGRIYSVSNPHRSVSLSTDGSEISTYDGLDRLIQITRPDGSLTHTYFGSQVGTNGGASSQLCAIGTYGLGYPILFVDEAGKKRQAWTNGFGKLIEVDEPDSGGSLTLPTCYQYDGLGNLTLVVQGTQSRSFVYDPLSRLTSATNPESGTITYTYDADSNIATKVAPAPNQTGSATVTTTYSYDALNRLTQKSYNDGTTPTPHYYYDLSNPWGSPYGGSYLGRLSEQDVFDASGQYVASHIYVYDPMGRVQETGQCTAVNCSVPGLPGFHTLYSHDLAGNLTSYQTVENGITLGYQYDSAGRASAVTNSFVDAQHPATLFTSDATNGYFPHGAIRKAALGNGLTETNVYNSRLQPCLIDVNNNGTLLQTCNDSTPTGNVLDLWMGYNAGSANNGNAVNWNATGAQSFVRTYGYDSLNRLSTMGDSASGQSCKGLSWTYDRWGNRTDQTVTSGTCNTFHATASTQNRLVDPVNNIYQYDTAGNMTYDGSHTYTYDAENRLTKVDGGNTATYAYDADGNRIQKAVGPIITAYVFSPTSHVIHETDPNLTFNVHYIYLGSQLLAEMRNSTTYFVHADHLGSTRMLTAMDQSIYDNVDYLPFGEQIAGDTGTTHKFTGKERDAESGLDNFGARYDSSSMGRFMSPDPMGGHPQDPQTLNRYAYVRNNPVSLTDPTGLDFYLRCGDNSDTCQNHRVGSFATNDDGSRGAFNATVVTSDSIRNGDNSATVGPNGVEVTTGGKTYTGEYFENPDSIKMENVNGESTFVDHNQITLGGKAGSGLENFSFFFNGNCSGACLASGTFDFNSTPDQTRNYLDAHGAFRSIVDRTIPLYGASLDEEFFHQGTTQHRFGEGPSLHVSVPRDPKATVPTMGLFHVDKDAPGLAHAGCAWFGVG